MRTLIETYRGWEIYFDTEKENFYAISNEYDRDEIKKSFASAKKYIDDYFKANVSFKPVRIQKMPNNYSGRDSVITLIGIRKDEAFMYEDSRGEKRQLSKYDEDSYFVVDIENDQYFLQIAEVEDKIKVLEKEIKSIESKVKRVGIEEIRKKYAY